MYLQCLKNLMCIRGLKASGVARAAGVSRAAVSKWMRLGSETGWVNVETNTIRQLAENQSCSPELFLREQPLLARLQVTLLWDALYDSIEAFVAAVVMGQGRALARLVQVYGFHVASSVAGPGAVRNFPQFKRFIPPARRRALESIWKLYL